MKKCSGCQQTKELFEFDNYKSSKDGKFHYCKRCRRKQQKQNKRIKSSDKFIRKKGKLTKTTRMKFKQRSFKGKR